MGSSRRRVALLIETSKGYGRGVLRGIGRYTRTRGDWEITVDERGLESPIPAWLESWDGDGAITRSESLDLPRVARRSGARVVHLGGRIHPDFPAVTSRESSIGELAIEHFRDRGFETLGFLGVRGARWSRNRRDAFVARARLHGLEPEILEISPRERPRGPGASLVEGWLREVRPPAAIFAAYDVLGIRVLETCRRLGLAVPEQVAVLGVDNDDLLCELATPALSSVEQDVEKIGFEAARMLDILMDGGEVPREVEVAPVGIVSRRSTDVVAIEDPQIARALQVIRDHACEGLSVDRVAEVASLSRRALERRFQVLLGRTPGTEILRVQIERAKQLLRETDDKLEVIAARCGFSSASYFCRAFSRTTGKTPRSWG